MQTRTVEQVMRVRRAHERATETLTAASSEAKSHLRGPTTPDPVFAPYRQADAGIEAAWLRSDKRKRVFSAEVGQ